jgi:uncharacterized protein YjiS (DUF1127 family)
MSTMQRSTTPAPGFRSAAWFIGTTIVSTMINCISYPIKFYRARREIALLAGLDDHQLRDIGLTRFDVANAAALPPQRSPTEALAAMVDERRRVRFRQQKTQDKY